MRIAHLLLPVPLLVAASPAAPHEDDPKILDRLPAHPGSGWSAARAGRGEGSEASVQFEAQGVQLLSWLTVADLGGGSSANDCWGYTSPSGREYAIVGTSQATAFVEVTDPSNAALVAVEGGPTSLWRDVKVHQHHAYSVSEGGSGIQVFDLSQIDSGTVTVVATVTTGGTNATHNVAIDSTSGYLYRCGGGNEGIRVYSLANPASPSFVGKWSDRYVHDAQVVTFTEGPHAGKQIAFCCTGFNGGSAATGLSILDVTDKSNIQHVGQITYPDPGYSHQCWLSEDGTILYLNDEADEDGFNPTTTHVIDVSDLSNPVSLGTFTNGNTAVGHNLYVRGNRIYEANYRSGLRVFDSTDPLAPVEMAWFDTWPGDDLAFFNGLWSNYPFFESGTVIGSDIQKGLFVWRVADFPVTFDFPAGVPDVIDPSGAAVVVHLEAEPGVLSPGTAKVHYDLGEGFVSADMTPLGGGDHEAALPAVPCGRPIDFYFSVESSDGITWVEPASGTPPYRVLAAESVATVVADDLESGGAGWVSGAPDDDAILGHWVLGDPKPTGAQPGDDHTDGGTDCWYTGKALLVGVLDESDVDGGKTTLLSPVYDLEGVLEPRITYWRWYSNGLGQNPAEDVFQVDVSNDGGATWTSLETVGPTGPDTLGGWRRADHRLQDFLEPTSEVRLRFVASDYGGPSIVEAAIDDLEIVSTGCADCDGDLASDDLQIAEGSVLDLDEDGVPDPCQPLSASAGEVSVSGGGAVDFVLAAGAEHALDLHLLLGSTSGTEPGTPFGGLVVPLNLDPYAMITLANPNTPPLPDSFGSLDVEGEAAARFELAAGSHPVLVGLTAHHAYVVLDTASGAVVFASNALPLELLP